MCARLSDRIAMCARVCVCVRVEVRLLVCLVGEHSLNESMNVVSAETVCRVPVQFHSVCADRIHTHTMESISRLLPLQTRTYSHTSTKLQATPIRKRAPCFTCNRFHYVIFSLSFSPFIRLFWLFQFCVHGCWFGNFVDVVLLLLPPSLLRLLNFNFNLLLLVSYESNISSMRRNCTACVCMLR